MLVLNSILPLFLVRYVFAAPSIIVPRQDLGADKSSIGLPSSLDERMAEIETKIEQELGRSISERDEFPSDDQSLPSSRNVARAGPPKAPITNPLLGTPEAPIIYLVPGTRIVLIIRLVRPVAEGPLAHVINLVHKAMNTTIHEHGDAQLPLDKEPYTAISRDGGVIDMASNLQLDYHLTYSDIATAAQGLSDVLIRQHRYAGAGFDIFRTGTGFIGNGSIGAVVVDT